MESVHCNPLRVGFNAKRLRGLIVSICLATAAAVSLPSCSCTPDPDAAKKAEEARKKLAEKKKKEKPKDDFEFKPVKTLPYDENPVQRLKPGHWASVAQDMRANNYDFQGQITYTPVDAGNRRVALDRAGYRMSMSRPLYLSKKQKGLKSVEMSLFAPVQESQRAHYSVEMSDRTGRVRLGFKETFQHMRDHEYYFIVLSREPDRYSFLKVLDSVNPPSGDVIGAPDSYYRVLLPVIDQRAPLPPTVLTWTSTAFVLWDDLEPGRLNYEQQKALVDWLFWGGQLLISGPESLDTLKGSFLEPYLPVRSEGTTELTEDDFAPINEKWTTPYPRFRRRPLEAKRPWTAVSLQPKESVDEAGILAAGRTGLPLLVEGRVGRGRVVVSAFRLRERDLRNWPGFDNFFNACLLRRPPREFEKGEYADGVQVRWANQQLDRFDPRPITGLRFFSRDAGYRYDRPQQAESEVDFLGNSRPALETERPPGSGLGGWSDFNSVSNAARETIQEAAGIEIPKASFVLWVLVAYLIVLVPVNWSIFKMIDRIEWAWVAAPVISLACAGTVIKLAQLDIGFARSTTDIAVVEIQASYPRAHVTRFTALYTSLSTPYTLDFEDAGALVQPFALDPEFRQKPGTSPETVEFFRTNKVTMTGYRVISNSTGLVHSEQMFDTGGSISITSSASARVSALNGTQFNLQRAALIRKVNGGNLQFAWLGDLPAGGTASGVFEATDTTQAEFWEQWRRESETADVLDLSRIAQVAVETSDMRAGDVKLVAASYDGVVPGMVINPSASQTKSALLVLANVQYGPLSTPRRDKNVAWDFRREPLRAVERDGEVVPKFND